MCLKSIRLVYLYITKTFDMKLKMMSISTKSDKIYRQFDSFLKLNNISLIKSNFSI